MHCSLLFSYNALPAETSKNLSNQLCNMCQCWSQDSFLIIYLTESLWMCFYFVLHEHYRAVFQTHLPVPQVTPPLFLLSNSNNGETIVSFPKYLDNTVGLVALFLPCFYLSEELCFSSLFEYPVSIISTGDMAPLSLELLLKSVLRRFSLQKTKWETAQSVLHLLVYLKSTFKNAVWN